MSELATHGETGMETLRRGRRESGELAGEHMNKAQLVVAEPINAMASDSVTAYARTDSIAATPRVEPLASVGRSSEHEPLPERLTPLRLFRGHFHRLALLAGAEAVLVFGAVYAAVLSRFPSVALGDLQLMLGPLWPHGAIVAAVFVACIGSMGLYQLCQRAGYAGVLARLVAATALAEVALAIAFSLWPSVYMTRGVLVVTGIVSFTGLALMRYAFLQFVDQDLFKRRVLVWGAGSRASAIATRLRRRADQRGFRVLAYVNAPGDSSVIDQQMTLRADTDLMRYILRNKVEEIVVAMDDRRQGFPSALLRECRLRGIAVSDVVCFLERESGRVSVELAQPSWLIFSDGFRSDLLRLAAKRVFDVTISLLVLALTWPLALGAAIAIWIEDRGPILYRQQRTGQNGRPFMILKFRSMSVNAEVKGVAVWAVKNDSRVTRVGAIIRKVRIDELPQLWNVLKGEMSFVGPRPERPMFVDQLNKSIPFYAERHFVKPGLTGWAQVRFPYGSSEADAREKLGYDLYYVKNHGILFDLMVMVRTVEIVLFRVGSR